MDKYCKNCKFRNAIKVCEIKKIYVARKNSCDFFVKKGKK